MERYTQIENEDAPLVPDIRRNRSRTTDTTTTGRGNPFEDALQEEAE